MTDDIWTSLRQVTQARIGLGRSGNGLPTEAELALRADHAGARDAVHEALDVAQLVAQLRPLGLGEPLVVASRAADRGEYLRRPDLGQALGTSVAPAPCGLAVVLADGLSARAAMDHGVPLVRALLAGGLKIGAVVVATQARVGLGDAIGAALGASSVLVLLGERPGLSVHDSLGAYLTYDPTVGRTDAQRNCVSNIRASGGTGYADAARVIVALLAEARRLGESGVRVKDRSERTLGGAADPLAL